jgi:3-oxoacyl-[acyl-carrier protein] reductase
MNGARDADGDFSGQVGLVTGSTRGIGLACAELLARGGAHVVINGTDPGLVSDVVATLPTSAIGVAGDITARDVPARLVSSALGEWGRLDIVINNAGYNWDAPLVSMTDEQFDAMLDVHLRAPFRTLRAAAPALLGAGSGSVRGPHRKVVNVSSVAGTMGSVDQANYNAAKAAIIGLTKGLAKEWGSAGINVNAVAPGFIESRLTAELQSGACIERAGRLVPVGIPPERRERGLAMVPLGRIGTPVDVAAAIGFLCSPASDYVNGEVLTVSGGLVMGMSA